MAKGTFEEIVLFEHQFWLQVLGDHARFIFHALSPNETKAIDDAKQFIQKFDTLLYQAREDVSGDALHQLTLKAQQAASEFRNFKLELLKRQLLGKISVGLSESFFNHMVNEIEEYLRILRFLVDGNGPPKSHPLHHHLIWVSDAAAHAGIIDSDLDLTEKQLKQKSRAFEQDFTDFYLKAIELAGYLRTNLDSFPALARYNADVQFELKIYKDFLEELKEIGLKNELLGIFTPLMADHMAREECYYLMKIAESANTPPPSCNPTKPRVTSMDEQKLT